MQAIVKEYFWWRAQGLRPVSAWTMAMIMAK